MGWWLWPRNTDGVVKDGCSIWQGGELGDDDRGLTASPHVLAALGERVHGAPILAPYFHMAIGWGITAARVLLGGEADALERGLLRPIVRSFPCRELPSDTAGARIKARLVAGHEVSEGIASVHFALDLPVAFR